MGAGGAAVELSALGRATTLTSNTTKPLYGLDGNSAGLAIAVGEAGAALSITDGAFTPESTGTVARLRAVTVTDDGSGWAVGDNGIIVARDAAGDWTDELAPTSNNLQAVTERDGDVWVVGDNGVILRRGDGDWSKENEAPGKFLYGVWSGGGALLAVGWTGLVLRRGDDGVWSNEESGTVNVLEAIDGAASGPVWVVGRKGTLLRRR